VSPLELDATLTRDAAALRETWLTPLMVVASAWPVKGLVFALLALLQRGAARDLVTKALLVGAATLAGSLASTAVKAIVERVRPPAELGLHALVAVPESWSFPSGHATTAGAGAMALALVAPRHRLVAAALALLIAASRVYLGVHFVGDVLAGLLLGAAVAALVVLAARRVGVLAPVRRGA
jgi:membrane-associated phospholipid phosphatase